MLLATLVAAISSLFDKYLLQDLHLDASTVQAWFSIYLLIVFWYPIAASTEASSKACRLQPYCSLSTVACPRGREIGNQKRTP